MPWIQPEVELDAENPPPTKLQTLEKHELLKQV